MGSNNPPLNGHESRRKTMWISVLSGGSIAQSNPLYPSACILSRSNPDLCWSRNSLISPSLKLGFGAYIVINLTKYKTKLNNQPIVNCKAVFECWNAQSRQMFSVQTYGLKLAEKRSAWTSTIIGQVQYKRIKRRLERKSENPWWHCSRGWVCVCISQ